LATVFAKEMAHFWDCMEFCSWHTFLAQFSRPEEAVSAIIISGFAMFLCLLCVFLFVLPGYGDCTVLTNFFRAGHVVWLSHRLLRSEANGDLPHHQHRHRLHGKIKAVQEQLGQPARRGERWIRIRIHFCAGRRFFGCSKQLEVSIFIDQFASCISWFISHELSADNLVILCQWATQPIERPN